LLAFKGYAAHREVPLVSSMAELRGLLLGLGIDGTWEIFGSCLVPQTDEYIFVRLKNDKQFTSLAAPSTYGKIVLRVRKYTNGNRPHSPPASPLISPLPAKECSPGEFLMCLQGTSLL
jgi:hypothetical protein